MKIPNQINLKKNGQYCLKCFNETVERVYKDNLTFYKCNSCGSVLERSLVIDDKINWWVDSERNYFHESSGVVVINEKGQILCLLRQIFPFAYSLPAGHVDANEDPRVSAVRELMEEVGLKDAGINFISEFDMPGDSCRRGSDNHKWHLYEAKIQSGRQLIINDEASKYDWLYPSEILKLGNITYPLEYVIKKFYLGKTSRE